jgi:hypothetical protein
MRVPEGVYAYELKRVRNQQTQLPVGWEYRVFRVKPKEKLLFIGQREERAHAEREAQQVIGLLKIKRAA